MLNLKRTVLGSLVAAALLLYVVVTTYAAGTPWAASANTGHTGGSEIEGKINWQTGSGSPAGSVNGTEGKDIYVDTTAHVPYFSRSTTVWGKFLTDVLTVTVAQGGTGLATLTAHALYAGNGTSAPTAIGPDASTTKALFAAGSSADPAFRAIAIATDITGLGTNVAAFLAVPSGANFNSMIAAGGVPISQNSKSAAYTTVLADGGGEILHPTADNNARTFTIDSNANVAYPIGTTITFTNLINTVTIAITSDTLQLAGTATTGSRTLAVGGWAIAKKVTSTLWLISGPGLT